MPCVLTSCVPKPAPTCTSCTCLYITSMCRRKHAYVAAHADLYSFDPTTREACSICGINFQCPGGDVVWCGVVWCGVVWCAVLCCAVLCCGVLCCGVVCCAVVCCAVLWCGVVWCGVVWCGVVWCGDVVWPEPKYWHSTPYSIQMHR